MILRIGTLENYTSHEAPGGLGCLHLCGVGGAPLQRNLQHAIAEAHKQRPVAVQNLQAQDWLVHAWWEELHLLEVTSLQALIGRGQSLQNRTVFCIHIRGEKKTVNHFLDKIQLSIRTLQNTEIEDEPATEIPKLMKIMDFDLREVRLLLKSILDTNTLYLISNQIT